MHSSRPKIVLSIVIALVVCGPRLVEVGAHTKTALGLARAAERCRDAGPLFLRSSCSPTNLNPTATTECSGDDLHGCYLEALALQAGGHGDAALSLLRRVVAAGYRRPFSATLLAYQLHLRGESDEAAAVWRTCADADCETLLVRAGNLDTCAASATLTRNQNSRASFCMGTLLRQADRLDEAQTWFRRALASSTLQRVEAATASPSENEVSRAEVFYRLGEIELTRGRLDEARELTSQSLAADPEHYWGGFQSALLRSRSGDTTGAIDELTHLIARYPAHGAAMLNLGILYESIGNDDEAEHWFLEARKVLPDKSLADVPLQRLRERGMPSQLP